MSHEPDSQPEPTPRPDVAGEDVAESAFSRLRTLVMAPLALVLLFLPALIVLSLLTLGLWMLPWLALIAGALLVADVLIFLPLALIPSTRPHAARGYQISSYIIGIVGLLIAIEVTLVEWGACLVVLGLLLGAIPLFPMGVVAAIIAGKWIEAAAIVLALILTYALMAISVSLDEARRGY